tara:strand:- start:145 stop:723 length:579 start_codon:yes stop_codon:yes gene_type:complete
VNINPRFHKTTIQINSEYKLIEEAKKDTIQFKYIYNNHYKIVFQFIYQRTGNETTTSDITSEVFYKALKNLNRYEFKGLPFSSWLIRIAQNEIITYYRKNRKSKIVRLETKHLQNLKMEDNTNQKKDFGPILLNTITKLKIDDFQLLEMRFFENRPFKEIAKILDKRESAVKMKVYRILQKLKVSIKNRNNI